MEIKTSDNLAQYTMVKSVKSPSPNFVLAFDDMGYGQPFGIRFEFTVKRTLLARVKYWLLCKFFPFKIERWDT